MEAAMFSDLRSYPGKKRSISDIYFYPEIYFKTENTGIKRSNIACDPSVPAAFRHSTRKHPAGNRSPC